MVSLISPCVPEPVCVPKPGIRTVAVALLALGGAPLSCSTTKHSRKTAKEHSNLIGGRHAESPSRRALENHPRPHADDDHSPLEPDRLSTGAYRVRRQAAEQKRSTKKTAVLDSRADQVCSSWVNLKTCPLLKYQWQLVGTTPQIELIAKATAQQAQAMRHEIICSRLMDSAKPCPIFDNNVQAAPMYSNGIFRLFISSTNTRQHQSLVTRVRRMIRTGDTSSN